MDRITFRKKNLEQRTVKDGIENFGVCSAPRIPPVRFEVSKMRGAE